MKILIALLALLSISACKTVDPLSAKNDPKLPWWGVGFTEPAHMTVWVETSAVEDIKGRLLHDVAAGAAASSNYENGTENARGWSGIGGSGMPVVGSDLPKRIYVRWQSIVERKTYAGWVEISEETRAIMRNSTAQRCHETPQYTANPSASMNLGLAPGGIIQVWVWDDCFSAHKVDRTQVGIEPLGPDQGQYNGYYVDIKESSKRYIERFGIPYGSW
ncbi:hypothetical protein BLL42_03235 [Pseudomonas frederiksbergensis]|uniref:DUF2931 domain-containing protein n=1 Tax=Pseudomonas frederiksbergensis TaxID=104087 RepID=A0A1J0EFA9_9PSED|nr:DUF2931 family protein [Pseudomonas frederiksbergensis]APC14786.1 hypothetical protein BLL42_03235 [Pseudomonas frederiksbergensis]